MKKRHEMIYSPAFERKMHVWCYGHWGTPLVVFPSAGGMAHEWENNGMVDVLAPWIESGRIKLYCPESNISQSWVNEGLHPHERAMRHQLYEHFIINTLVPGIYADCNSSAFSLCATGCSFGGYFATNFALKFPETFNMVLSMSGRYDLNAFTNGYSSEDIYFNNPIAYMGQIDGPALDRIRHNTYITLVCGQGDYEAGCIEETRQLAHILSEKSVPNYIDIWGHDSAHAWEWWQRQVVHHVGRLFP